MLRRSAVDNALQASVTVRGLDIIAGAHGSKAQVARTVHCERCARQRWNDRRALHHRHSIVLFEDAGPIRAYCTRAFDPADFRQPSHALLPFGAAISALPQATSKD